jgi:nitroimidazol reductase NimA-like FMN-containing flavoprotein (pyridoxamine 5'-phosphate oxidase superfamily)
MERNRAVRIPTSQALRFFTTVPRLDLDWAAALARITETETYLITTVSGSGRPHVVPVLGVWVDDFLAFTTEVSALKARHLAANPAIAVAAAGTDDDFTIEGTAELITDPDTLRAVAEAFPRKYEWWQPEVIDGRFVADDVSVVRSVYAVHPDRVFGFGKADGFSATRWTFPARVVHSPAR